MVSWRNIGDVERLDVLGVFEHRSQLAGERVEFLFGKLEHRQTGHLRHVVAGEWFRHGAQPIEQGHRRARISISSALRTLNPVDRSG